MASGRAGRGAPGTLVQVVSLSTPVAIFRAAQTQRAEMGTGRVLHHQPDTYLALGVYFGHIRRPTG